MPSWRVLTHLKPVILQGGKEATKSNAILHRLIVDAIEDVAPEVLYVYTPSLSAAHPTVSAVIVPDPNACSACPAQRMVALLHNSAMTARSHQVTTAQKRKCDAVSAL